MLNSLKRKLRIKQALLTTGLSAASGMASADVSLGSAASLISQSMEPLALLITGGCYVGGLAFMVGAIMKFKQHKDNPTQVTIGTPIALLLVGAALLFMPSVMGMAGQTIFGGGTTAGPGGSAFTRG
ncbi:type IV secretion protein IcmD [Legionella sp. CNM-4043-24]|uniref:type IV secretion protein IcmD n=1 Tax=Legionella sp. CNM-4043-24 TaxID=3421646 RepID=UPI00403AB392